MTLEQIMNLEIEEKVEKTFKKEPKKYLVTKIGTYDLYLVKITPCKNGSIKLDFTTPINDEYYSNGVTHCFVQDRYINYAVNKILKATGAVNLKEVIEKQLMFKANVISYTNINDENRYVVDIKSITKINN